MFEHKDEILLPVLDSDAAAVPRYNIVGPDGKTLYENVALKLMNQVAQEGTPVNKPLLDEFLAAAGVTAGSATAYTLAQAGYSLADGAEVRFRLHTASGSGATLNVGGTGAKPLRDALGKAMANSMPAGTWLKAIYSTAAGAYVIQGGGGIGSNPNLLDNWYLADPINQRGQTEYATGNPVYTIDRWKNASGSYTCKMVLGDGGVTFVGGTSNGYWNQLIDNPTDYFGKNITISVLDADGQLYTDSGVVPTSVQSTEVAVARAIVDGSNVYVTAQLQTTGVFRVNIRVAPGCSIKIAAVKLELGSTQTLAHQDADGNWILNDPPPDKGMELLKCIQSTADPADTYANKVVLHTGNKNLITPADIGAVPLTVPKIGVDVNTLVAEGRYFVINCPNAPDHGFLEVKYYDGGGFAPDSSYGVTKCVRQTFKNYGEGDYRDAILERYGLCKTSISSEWEWSEWEQIATTNYAVNKAGDTMTGALALVAGSTIGGNTILHTGNIGNYVTGSAKILTNTRLSANAASVAITLPADYNYFRVVISTITVTTPTTVAVDCAAATNKRHEGIWLFDVLLDNEPGVAGFIPQSYDRLTDVQIPDVGSMASITMDVHRTSDGLQGQAIAVTNGDASDGDGEVVIGSWYASGSGLTEITVSANSGYMRAGTRIMVIGVK